MKRTILAAAAALLTATPAMGQGWTLFGAADPGIAFLAEEELSDPRYGIAVK